MGQLKCAIYCALAVLVATSCSGNTQIVTPLRGATPTPSPNPCPPAPSPTPTMNPSATAYPTGSLYVVNAPAGPSDPVPPYFCPPTQGTTGVTVYAPGASGDAKPLGTILTPYRPSGLAFDSANRLYVSSLDAISVYAPGANGNAAPLETISGSKTGLNGLNGIALDPEGNIYVANGGGSDILEFGPFSPGSHNVAPSATISPQEGSAAAGLGCVSVFRGDVYGCVPLNPPVIEAFPAGTSGADAQPASTIGSSAFDDPGGLAFDSHNNVYVVNAYTLTVFGNVNGNVPSGEVMPAETYAVNPPNTPFGPDLDAAGNIYLAYDSNEVVVLPPFAAGSNNVMPIRTIQGNDTGLTDPRALAVH